MDQQDHPGSPSSDQPLEKPFTRLTMIGMSFAILNTWIALAGVLGIVMPSGGPVAFFYGFLICVAANLCITASLGELGSIWPTAGGQYHWSYALAVGKWRNFVSFLVGWVNIAGWLTLVTTEAFFAAQFVSAALVVGTDTYEITAWKTYLIFCAISLFGVLLNIFGYHILGRWNEGSLLWSVVACIVISVTILATSSKNDAKYIFTNFDNTTGWNDGVSWMLGLCQSALSLIGFDAVAHMVEEMPRPTRDAPIAMMASVTIGGVTGAAFILVMCSSLTDLTTVLATPTGMPITELIHMATKSRAAAVLLTVALAVCFVNGTSGCITSGSRLLWAMSRDQGSLFSDYFAHIDPKLHVPVRAIMATAIFNMVFGLLYLGPTVAFNAYIASCTIFLNCSYAAPILILLIRGRGLLSEHRLDFHLGHYRGLILNVISVIYAAVTSVFFLLPNALPVSVSDMNYVSVVLALFLGFVAVLWAIVRRHYEGPQFDLVLEAVVTNRSSERLEYHSQGEKEK